MTPRTAASTITALFACGVSASVFRIPIQVSDSVEVLEVVDREPSVAAAFMQGLHASKTMLRPMRQVGTRLLLDVAHATGSLQRRVPRFSRRRGSAADCSFHACRTAA